MYIDGYEAKESERSIIGLILRDASKCAGLIARLEPEDFSNVDNRAIFVKMRDRVMAHQAVDLANMGDAMPESIETLCDAATALCSMGEVESYLANLNAAKRRRKLYTTGKELMTKSERGDIDTLIEKTRLQLKSMRGIGGEELALEDVIVEVHESLYSGGKQTGITLGIDGIDQQLLGFQPGALYVIGARPSVGKSVFGMIAAMKAGEAGKRSLIINREMKKSDVVRRMLAHISGIDIAKIRTGRLDMTEQTQLADCYEILNNRHVCIANEPKTPMEIREAAMRLYEQDGLDLLVVDYLQRLSSGRRTGNRDEEVGTICWAIKDLAMDLDIPVILLSQLNRSAVNQRPNMANLRESGNIEQDADTVILLHRPDRDGLSSKGLQLHDFCTSRGGSMLEMIVDKNRDGLTCIVPVMFRGATMDYISLGGTA